MGQRKIHHYRADVVMGRAGTYTVMGRGGGGGVGSWSTQGRNVQVSNRRGQMGWGGGGGGGGLCCASDISGKVVLVCRQ